MRADRRSGVWAVVARQTHDDWRRPKPPFWVLSLLGVAIFVGGLVTTRWTPVWVGAAIAVACGSLHFATNRVSRAAARRAGGTGGDRREY